jgi:hypothetical protein
VADEVEKKDEPANEKAKSKPKVAKNSKSHEAPPPVQRAVVFQFHRPVTPAAGQIMSESFLSQEEVDALLGKA